MSTDIAIPAIEQILANDTYRQKKQQCAQFAEERFSSLLADLATDIDALHASHGPISLYVLDSLSSVYLDTLAALSPEESGLLAKHIVASRLEALPANLTTWALPPGIVLQYIDAVRYMTQSIVSQGDAEYGDVRSSYFDRDLRLTSGLSLPLGAQIIDLRVWAPRTLYRNKGFAENLRCLLFVKLRLRGLGPLVRIHADSRMAGSFNEEGRIACFLQIAQLMALMPDIRGFIGTSWYYDPQVKTISPKLAYLSHIPMENGAFLRVDGSGDIHTQRALERSPTRRRLFEEGKYKPVCATMIWTREKLMGWARKYERSH